MTEVKPFIAEHMMALLEEGIMECGIASGGTDALWALAFEREREGSYSGYIDDELVGCAGVSLLWEGVGEFWLMLSEKGKKNPTTTFKTIKRNLDEIVKEKGLWRAQTTGRIDYPEACRMIEMFGFKNDCTLEKYGPDKSDYYLYSMVI